MMIDGLKFRVKVTQDSDWSDYPKPKTHIPKGGWLYAPTNIALSDFFANIELCLSDEVWRIDPATVEQWVDGEWKQVSKHE